MLKPKIKQNGSLTKSSCTYSDLRDSIFQITLSHYLTLLSAHFERKSSMVTFCNVNGSVSRRVPTEVVPAAFSDICKYLSHLEKESGIPLVAIYARFVSRIQDRAVSVTLFSQALSCWVATKSYPTFCASSAHGIEDDLSFFIKSIAKNKK